ncbi:calcium-binding protein [Actinoplanes couchii]|uniref:calcium-binding protein n=1 Tax=Actinoplanes couchii TaxID=403638 RepID=UPI001943CED7|nr:calcium-binding protein [Actinoplanes couchii]MDR6324748.1 Ca2+-binding RTX toxin-like protein [Actinoplanes couchii]
MISGTWLTRAGIALVGTTAAVGMFAAPAQAAGRNTVSVLGDSLIYWANKGQVNRVWIGQSGGKVVLDDRVALTAGEGCTLVEGDRTRVVCTGVTQVHINLRDRDDVFVNRTGLTTNVAGANGNDTLIGGTGRDYLSGGRGDDVLKGGAGDDLLTGGAGRDLIHGNSGSDSLYDGAGVDRAYGGTGDDLFWDGRGADRLHGGAGNDRILTGKYVDADRYYGGVGIDRVDYRQRTGPVTADADGRADDGQTGEKDRIAPDVENLTGGKGDDTLIGNRYANVLDGREHVKGDTCVAGGGDTTRNCEIVK